MSKIERLILICSFMAGCCAGQCHGQVVRLQTADNGKATAVCVGETECGGRLFVTAGHNFCGGRDAQIYSRGQWHPITAVRVSEADDVAAFEAQTDTTVLPLYEGEAIPSGTVVDVAGFGLEYHGRGTGARIRAARLVSIDTLQQDREQVVPGDSGGVVHWRDRTLGIVNGFQTDEPLRTVWTPARTISECLSHVYRVQCPPGGCPVYIQRRPVQPMVGIPVGPPRMITEISPNPPQRYVPAPIPDPISTPVARGERGPQGPPGERGPEGPAGRDGRPGQDVSKEHVEAVIAAWLEANREQLRGEPGRDGKDGPAGERGLIGVPSEAELQAVIDTWVQRNEPRIRELVAEVVREQLRGMPHADVSAIESRLTAVENRPIRVILSEGGKIRDDETYQPGEPLVFALERLRSGSNAK